MTCDINFTGPMQRNRYHLISAKQQANNILEFHTPELNHRLSGQ